MSGLDRFAGDDDAQNDDRPRLAKPGALENEESMTVTVAAPPEVVETEYDDAVRFEAEFQEADHSGDFDGEGPFEEGDAVAVLTWSKRLVRALRRARNDQTDGDTLAGETVTITAFEEPDDEYSRTYDVAVLSDDDE